MIFEYEELKECVQEDFDRFMKWDLMKNRFFLLF